MKLLAFDLETTGTDPYYDQILQIGAVAFDPETSQRSYFEALVSLEKVTGSPYALAMNASILKRIANGEGQSMFEALESLKDFISKEFDEKPIPVGFNVGAFDVAFINSNIPTDGSIFHHRSIELGTLLMSHFHSSTPISSSQAIKLLGEDKEVAHDALQDAKDAADLYMLWYTNARTWVKHRE